MALNLSELSSIEVERQLLVSGYIHEHERMSKQNIPKGIILICILFYGNDVDEWDENQISEAMKLSERTITKNTTMWELAVCSYCKRIVDYGKLCWRFKIEQCAADDMFKFPGDLMIGIWKVNDQEPPKTVRFTRYGDGYGFDPILAKLTNNKGHIDMDHEYGEECTNGTIIEMILDMNELTLSYKIDNKDYGKAFDVGKCKYRAAVYMLLENNSITLLE